MTKYFCSFRSLASITIDYGPFGFVDDYDAHYTPNHSDDGGRYDFANQPDVAEWNLKMLAMSLMPIIPSESNPFTNFFSVGRPVLSSRRNEREQYPA